MKIKYFLILLLLTNLFSCKKDFLTAKPDKRQVVPTTLKDFQSLLNHTDIMNFWMPYMGEISSDDYYLESDAWQSLNYPPEKNGYIWNKEILEGNSSSDWGNMYRIVFYANNILEGLQRMKTIDEKDAQSYDEIKGSALFFRAYAFYQLSQLFCAPYDASTLNEGLGIPLRLKSDINLPTIRSTIAQTYSQILKDLTECAGLLPKQVVIKTQPRKTAAYAMLSRVYLMMQDYEKSLNYADSALLQPGEKIIDLNNVNTLAAYPMERYNAEVIFHTTLNYASNLTSNLMNLDSVLYNTYLDNDLRKSAWFTLNNERVVFKGNYNGASPYLFSGLGFNEVYLNKAECLARKSKTSNSMTVLNSLLEKRFETGTFSPYMVSSSNEALEIILRERRKELLFRGVRWSDLRRLNLDPTTSKTLYRIIEGKRYELSPNSPNYIFQIEDDVIRLSGIEQNPRK